MESFQGSGGGDVSELGSLVQDWTMFDGTIRSVSSSFDSPKRKVCIDSSYYMSTG
jgi:hypothetical protein